MLQNKKQHHCETSPKRKLRTAAEVINRLKWSGIEEASPSNVLMGYDCRINGPMEKCVEDYTNINEGGDIPEHRIQYFRKTVKPAPDDAELSRSVMWDRAARVDRLFGSGHGNSILPAPQTVHNIRMAMQTMRRLAEERKERMEEKRKQRARKAARQTAAAKANAMKNGHTAPSSQLATSGGTIQTSGSSNNSTKSHFPQRHCWKNLPGSYAFNPKVTPASTQTENNQQQHCIQAHANATKLQSDDDDLKLVTWNVLFDLHRDANDKLAQGDDSLLSDSDSTCDRWQRLMDDLERSNADIIALQEVTPRFLKLLERQPWVRRTYALSDVHSRWQSTRAYGNVMLWNKTKFEADDSFVCVEGDRDRGMIVTLLHGTRVYNVANVHLPADKFDHDTQTTSTRSQARRRELAAFVAKLQLIQREQEATQIRPVTFIMGDFNDGADAIPYASARYFDDAWVSSKSKGEHHCTFDWKTNARANKTRQYGHAENPPRRIDRIFVVKDVTMPNRLPIQPMEASLLGRHHSDPLPPSDHYGVCVRFEQRGLSQTAHSRMEASSSAIDCNAWAATVPTSTDSILAIQLNQKQFYGLDMYDRASSLPIPHITLMYGFVELSNANAMDMATRGVKMAIQSTFAQQPDGFHLPIDAASFRVFEHAQSSSLVYTPNMSDPRTRWLQDLYAVLRVAFPNCHDQESRFKDGWTPHISLGKYATVDAARQQLQRIRFHFENQPKQRTNAQSNMQEDAACLDCHSVGIFRRSSLDKSFYCCGSIPLAGQDKAKIPVNATKSFINDSGSSRKSFFDGTACGTLHEIERACHTVAAKQFGDAVEVQMRPFGSHATRSTLPGISDVDMVVVLRSKARGDDVNLMESNADEFFNALQVRIKSLHGQSRCRLRTSNASGRVLSVLTVRLMPATPAVDIQICFEDGDGQPLDSASAAALASVHDVDIIVERLRQIATQVHENHTNMVDTFSGALRIIKLWASRRQIYGTGVGYLGGYGWTIWLASILFHDLANGSLVLPTNQPAQDTQTQTYQQKQQRDAINTIVVHFFKAANHMRHSSPLLVMLPKEMYTAESINSMDAAKQVATKRKTMAVVAPVSGGNCARSSTPSTTQSIIDEITRAASMTQNAVGDDGTVSIDALVHTLLPFNAEIEEGNSSSSGSTHCLVLQINQRHNEERLLPAQVKHWGSLHLLQTVLATESFFNQTDSIRPSSKMYRSRTNAAGGGGAGGDFAFVIQIKNNVSFEQPKLKDWLQERNAILNASQRVALPNAEVSLSFVDSDELNAFAGGHTRSSAE